MDMWRLLLSFKTRLRVFHFTIHSRNKKVVLIDDSIVRHLKLTWRPTKNSMTSLIEMCKACQSSSYNHFDVEWRVPFSLLSLISSHLAFNILTQSSIQQIRLRSDGIILWRLSFEALNNLWCLTLFLLLIRNAVWQCSKCFSFP